MIAQSSTEWRDDEFAEIAITRYEPTTCMVLAGRGGNGGGGLAAARHLHNRGVQTAVLLAAPMGAGVPLDQLQIIRRLGVPVVERPHGASVVIDAIIGYGLRALRRQLGRPPQLKPRASAAQESGERSSQGTGPRRLVVRRQLLGQLGSNGP